MFMSFLMVCRYTATNEVNWSDFTTVIVSVGGEEKNRDVLRKIVGVRDFFVCRPFLGPSLHSFQRLSNAVELDLQFVLRFC